MYLLLADRRTIPKTTSGKIARAMCKRAHVAGTLDKDTIYLWGETATSVTDEDARAEQAETAAVARTGDSADGVEESKGKEEDPRLMTQAQVLRGIQVQVARILKADAGSIPTVSSPCPRYRPRSRSR